MLLESYFELYPDNKQKEKYFFFDEIQSVNNWELFIRRIADKEKVKIYLTGSSSKLLSHEIATALRGRTLTFSLFPLSFLEFLKFKNVEIDKNVDNLEYSTIRFKIKNLLEEYLNFGGFPEIAKTDTLKRDILTSYYDMILYKDLVDRYSIRNILLLKHLTNYLLTNLASLFSVNSYFKSIHQTIKVAKDTILEYLSYLVDVNFIFLIPLFSYSVKVQQANPTKIYCVDSGLRNVVAFKFSQDEGRLVENCVFLSLKRKGWDVFYWKGKREVDFAIKMENNQLQAINVCYSDEIKLRETEGLHEFKTTFASQQTDLILLTRNLEQEKDGIRFVPLWKWLLKNS